MGRPGTPSLLREINDRAALELLLAEGPLTRAQVGEGTGLSKVTASQTLTRLEERGLVAVTGQQAGGRGPSAAVYAIIPSTAIVAGLDVAPEAVTTGVADVTGQVLAEVTVDPNGVGDRVADQLDRVAGPVGIHGHLGQQAPRHVGDPRGDRFGCDVEPGHVRA